MREHHAEERRKNGGFSDEQIDAIKQAILDSIYQEIGRSVVRKVLWVAGTLAAVGLTWLATWWHFKFPGATE